jgi:hypothetical protein
MQLKLERTQWRWSEGLESVTKPSGRFRVPYLRVAERDVDGLDTFAVSSGLGISVEGNSWSTTLVRKDLDLAHCSAGTL